MRSSKRSANDGSVWESRTSWSLNGTLKRSRRWWRVWPGRKERTVERDASADEATWKQRFRVAKVTWAWLAEERRDRGVAASDRSGRTQLYAWDAPTGDLRQLTDRPEGMLFGYISPDGHHVYYLDDKGGNEIGHLV